MAGNSGSVEGPGRIRLEVATDLARVGEIVEQVASCCLLQSAGSERLRFRVCTVMAEALANAMVYGNQNDPQLTVAVELTLYPDRLVLMVADKGEGFEHWAVPHPAQLSPESQTGRGLFLIRALSDQMEFNSRGNVITMTLRRA